MAKSLKFNFLMNLILTLSNFLFPLITFPYVSRVLLPEGTGKVAFALSIITYFAIFASFGVATYGIRATAQVRDDKIKLSKTVHEILCINAICTSIIYAIFLIIVFYVPEIRAEYQLFLVLSLTLLFSIGGMEWLYKGLEQYSYITTRTIIIRLLATIATFLFIKNQQDYIIFAAITAFSTVGSNFINIINLPKIIYLKRIPSYSLRPHLKPMSLFFLTSLAIAIYTNVDSTMLGFMQSTTEVGYYNAALKIKAILLAVVTSLGVVLLPRLSYYLKNNRTQEFNDLLSQSMSFIFVLSLPIVCFFIFFAKDIIIILAGTEYLHSVLPLQIISVTILFIGITNILGIQILVPSHQENALLLSVLIGAIVNIAINLLLIPSHASIGTSISSAIAELCVLIAQLFILKKYFTILFKNIEYLKIIVSIAISSSLSCYFYHLIQVDLFITMIITTSIFATTYLLSLFILKESFIIYSINKLTYKINNKKS